jgi:hypothetical protein
MVIIHLLLTKLTNVYLVCPVAKLVQMGQLALAALIQVNI